MNEQKIIVKAKEINGTNFVGIRNYTNKAGEISNQTLLVGYNLINVLKHDREAIEAIDVKAVVNDIINIETANKAKQELIASLDKRLYGEEEKQRLREQGDSTINRSDAQCDAYTPICKGVKKSNADNSLKISGLVVRKETVKKGEYKAVKSRPKTIAKRKIQELARAKATKIRMFTIKDGYTIAIGNELI